MAKTELDLVTRALREIAVTDINSPPEAEEAEYAREAWRTLYQELSDGERMAFTFTTDAIPENLFLPLAMVLAGRIAPGFSRPFDADRAMRHLRRVVFPDDRTGDAVPVTFY